METIKKTSVINEIVARIMKEISSSEYAIGDKLPTERELCEELGVGRSSVREALRMLQAHGVIDIQQGRGAFVRSKDGRTDETAQAWFAQHRFQLEDFMEVRMAIEPLAVKLAIERAKDDEIARIGEILSKFEEATLADDVEKLASYDEALHGAIFAATHNALLIAIHDKVAEAFREYRSHSFSAHGGRSALEPHQLIFHSLVARDTKGAVRAMKRHLVISLADIEMAVENDEKSRSGR